MIEGELFSIFHLECGNDASAQLSVVPILMRVTLVLSGLEVVRPAEYNNGYSSH